MTYVEGIGDEVLLFFTFVIASFGILLFLFLRETLRRNNNALNQTSHSVDSRVPFDDSSNLQPSSTPATNNDFQQRTPVSSAEYLSTTREENFNTAENATEGTRSNELTLRLILQERTINARVFYSTTLQELKRYNYSVTT